MNLATLLANAARVFADRPAVSVGSSVQWSYAELVQRAATTGGALRKTWRLPAGARVGLAMSNCAEFFQVLFGCWQAGLCAVPINAKLHPREFAYILDHSGASLCFTTPDLHGKLAPLADELPELRAVVSTAEERFQRLREAAPAPVAETQPTDPAWLFYTSGTTGRPKGAVLTHRVLLFMINSYYADLDFVDARDTMLHAAPLSHGSGLYGLPHIAKGSHQVIPGSGHFDPAEIFDLIERHPNVSFFAAPTMISRLINNAAAQATDGRNLKSIIYGGGPMYLADLERALELFGPKLVQVYGQGESPMTITALSKAMHAERDHPRYRERLASCGVARTGVEVRVVDGEDRDLPPGEVGEVATRSDCVMAGYWRNPEATAESLRGGWLHTGDLGSLDAEGFLTLKDRSTDLIISGGANIYPREVEETLLRHAGVVEAAVVGRPHSEWGEQVVAFVVARPDAVVTEEVLDRLCLDHIARFKRPRHYVFVDDLPKNNYGKVVKTVLRERLAEGGA